jgi:hypothetical protein
LNNLDLDNDQILVKVDGQDADIDSATWEDGT